MVRKQAARRLRIKTDRIARAPLHVVLGLVKKVYDEAELKFGNKEVWEKSLRSVHVDFGRSRIGSFTGKNFARLVYTFLMFFYFMRPENDLFQAITRK